MLRKPIISHDDWVRNQYNTVNMQMRTPRKMRLYEYSNQFQPTIYYHRQVYRPAPDDPESAWLGKILVEWDGESVWDYAKYLKSMNTLEGRAADPNGENRFRIGKGTKDHVFEFEIAKWVRPNIYRILYVDPVVDQSGKFVKWELKSKPAIEYRPGRMNLYVDTVENRIRQIAYF
jgi:hypothetical protein